MLHSNGKKILVFGYLYISQRDGTEKILLKFPQKDTQWEFPILGEYDPCVYSPDHGISLAVSNFLENENFVSKEELRTSGLYPFEYYFVPLEKGEDYACFFKMRILSPIGKPSELYIWVDKTRQFLEKRRFCLQSELLQAIEQFKVYHQVGFKMLECLDNLIFRKNGDQTEFLMLKREDRSISVSGWEYSKGPVLFHETHREAAARELVDETGLGIENFKYIMDLGYQTVNVDWRKKNYDTLHLLGMTYFFTGDKDNIVPYKKEGLRRSTWMSWEEAKATVWMKDYGPVFFDRWKENEKEILRLTSA